MGAESLLPLSVRISTREGESVLRSAGRHRRDRKGLTTVVSSFYLMSDLDWRYVRDQEGRTGDFICEY